MRITYSNSGAGQIALTKPEYDVLPVGAKKRLKSLAMTTAAENGSFVFGFYGGLSLDMALEVCRYHNLTLEPYRLKT